MLDFGNRWLGKIRNVRLASFQSFTLSCSTCMFLCKNLPAIHSKLKEMSRCGTQMSKRKKEIKNKQNRKKKTKQTKNQNETRIAGIVSPQIKLSSKKFTWQLAQRKGGVLCFIYLFIYVFFWVFLSCLISYFCFVCLFCVCVCVCFFFVFFVLILRKPPTCFVVQLRFSFEMQFISITEQIGSWKGQEIRSLSQKKPPLSWFRPILGTKCDLFFLSFFLLFIFLFYFIYLFFLWSSTLILLAKNKVSFRVSLFPFSILFVEKLNKTKRRTNL